MDTGERGPRTVFAGGTGTHGNAGVLDALLLEELGEAPAEHRRQRGGLEGFADLGKGGHDSGIGGLPGRRRGDEFEGSRGRQCQHSGVPGCRNDSAARNPETVAMEASEVVSFSAADLGTRRIGLLPGKHGGRSDGGSRDFHIVSDQHQCLLV